jgi:alginate O-acetyltransferase complex protein AlgI
VRFNSLEFGVFLAVVFALAALFKGRRRNVLLLLASYFFYGSWNPPFLLLLWFSTLLDFVCGGRIGKTDRRGVRTAYLMASIVGNLGILFYFKYGNFFLDNIAFISGIDPEPFYLKVVIPLGISFYTFQSMSYTLDVFRRETKPCRSFLDFSLYVTFFPQLIAGPILRASQFLPQLRRTDPVRTDEILRGIELFLVGLFKKVVVADNIALLADRVFAEPTRFSAAAIALGSVAFAIQIYCDFSGYSTMARGLGSLFGFKLPRNFDYPLLRWNPLLIRQSWHMTMGRWFQDYVYRPMSRGRVGDVRFAFNIIFNWMLLGLWHGASWHFVAWGLSNGVQLAAYLVVLRRKRWALPEFPGKRFLGWCIIFSLWIPSAIFFRAGNMAEAWTMLVRLFSGAAGLHVAREWAFGMGLLGAVHFLSFRYYKEDLLQRLGWAGRVAAVSATVLAIALLGATGRPFIYFQF